jgi:branched-subunit amino acid transport protein AzlD
MLSSAQALIIIAMMAAGTALTRFLPFVLFRKKTPNVVLYLGKLLPPAAISLLVVYSLRDVSFAAAPFGLPEFISIAVVAALHIWKKNTLLSIVTGTIVYMILVQLFKV